MKGARTAWAILAALPLAGCGSEFFTGPEVEATATEPGAPVYRASGSFGPLAYQASGRAGYLIDAEGNAALELDEGFSAPDLPGVAVFLSNAGDLSDAVRVGALEATEGPVRWTFRMPRGAVWRYALVWSEALGVGVARAELVPEE